MADPRTMSFGDHLEELRKRLFYAVFGIIPIFIGALIVGKQVLAILLRPAQDQLRRSDLPSALQATSPLESFGSYFKVSVIITVIVALPWIIWQLWKFVAPGLYEHERRFARLLVPLSITLSAIGVAFLYYAMLPAILTFLITFGATIPLPAPTTAPLAEGVVLPQFTVLANDPVDPPPGSYWFNSTLNELRIAVVTPEGALEVRGTPLTRATGISQQYRVSEYVDLVFFMGLAFALGFQMPVVVLLLGWIGVVDRKLLVKNRRYAVFFCAVGAALLTPSPDPFSMLLLAIPLYGLYELGLFLLRFMPAERVARGAFRWPRKEPVDAGDA